MTTRTKEERFRLWKVITVEYEEGNLNLKAVCDKHGVHIESYYNWNDKFKGNKVVTIDGEVVAKPVVIESIKQLITQLKERCPNLILAAREDDTTVHLVAQGDCNELWDMQMCLKEKQNGKH